MKVILAGYSKTGTKSLNAALTILGYNVYDYMEHVTKHGDEWIKIFNEGWTTEDFRKMYENVDAVTDAPTFYFWEEIHKAFPDAKIILMIRDEESWYKSMTNQLLKGDQTLMLHIIRFLSPTTRFYFDKVSRRLGNIIFGLDIMPSLRKRKLNKQLSILKYRAHNAYVMQNAPKDKLLIFNCSQGWEPLCEFLNISVPDVDFPHKNKNGDLLPEMMEKDPFTQRVKREARISLSIITLGVTVGGYYLWTRGPTAILNTVVDSCRNVATRLDLC